MQANVTVERGPLVGSSFVVRPGPPFVMGSGPGVQVKVDGGAARHAVLLLDPAGLKVVDLAGGVTLDDAPLPPRQPVPVGTGQAIGVSGTLLRVELDGVPEPARAVAAAPCLPRLEGFEVLAVLGQGGMGMVLHARAPDGREVAVKLLHDEVPLGSPEHRRFLIEGRVGQRVRSPYVVEVLEARVDAAGRPQLVLELVRGPSLQATVARHGPLAVSSALRIGEHAALGLAAAHAAGVLHRDVKPANILLAPDGVAKLTDFGVAKDLDGSVRSLTRSGMGLGTLAYMAPEQADGARHVDVAADLYGHGASLFHALTGRPPFEVSSVEALFASLQTPAPPLAALRPEVPPGLARLVAALLAKDPADRPTSAREVATALRSLGC